jgi:hypothetical protein
VIARKGKKCRAACSRIAAEKKAELASNVELGVNDQRA